MGRFLYFFRNIYWHILGSFHCIFTVLDFLQTGGEKKTQQPFGVSLMCVNLAPLKLFSLKINLSAFSLHIASGTKRSNGCAPVWPEVHHWSRALSKACLLVFHKWTLYFPNTYIDPEIQALTRLSRERGVLKGCFTSWNVGWIQCENSKLVKSTWNSIHPFYFSISEANGKKKGRTWFDSLGNEKQAIF